MQLNICTLFDKVDGFTDKGNFIVDKSLREICRQYLQLFKRNTMLIPAEWELRLVATVDEESCVVTPVVPPRTISPNEVLGLVDVPAGTTVED